MKYHTPVLLQEVIKIFDPKSGEKFIDATVGGGGHTFEILKREGKILGIDRDPEAVKYIKNQFHPSTGQSKFQIDRDLILVNDNFAKIATIAKDHGFEKVDGILFDLGVSFHQLEAAQRGFSFEKSGPLDMRMDPNLTLRAYDLINNFDRRRLNEIFKTYGQEKLSWSIAGAICSTRQIEPIKSTTDLASIVQEIYREYGKRTRLHPATKTFLALRIVVNSELLNLEDSLPQTVDLLEKGGRLVVVSFHSLEDGIVKRFFKREPKLKVVTPKPIGPKIREILENPRSRSAKLRAAQKL